MSRYGKHSPPARTQVVFDPVCTTMPTDGDAGLTTILLGISSTSTNCRNHTRLLNRLSMDDWRYKSIFSVVVDRSILEQFPYHRRTP